MRLIPEGKYKGQVEDWYFAKSSKGTPYIAVRFRLLNTGDFVWWYGYFSPATIERTVESLRYCGWTGCEIDRMAEDGMGSKQPILVIEHEEYEGQVRARVRWINSGDPVVSAPRLKDDELRAFSRELRDSIRAIDESKRHAGQASGVQDDDIPF